VLTLSSLYLIPKNKPSVTLEKLFMPSEIQQLLHKYKSYSRLTEKEIDLIFVRHKILCLHGPHTVGEMLARLLGEFRTP
jgi:hypothetical protein